MLVNNDMSADSRVDREARALAQAGHCVAVVALRTPAAPDTEERDGYRVARAADYTTAGWARPIAKLAQSRARSRALADAALALRPDVVHAHDSDTLAAADAVARASGAALVYDAHELFPDMLLEHGVQGTWPVQRYWRRLERRLVPRADAVVTVSPGLATELAARFGVEPVVVANVPPLVAASRSERLRTELGLPPDTPIALYQGVLTRGRGLERLVTAWAHVAGAVLAVQGFGPVEDDMRAAAVDVGLADRVRFMGRIAPEDLHEYATGADLGVVIYEHTTLNNYLAAPNKLFAYLMAGLPVAASDFPGLASIVEGEAVGATFDPADAASIAAAVNGLLADVPLRREMAVRARRLAETRFNWDVEKTALLAVYEGIAARRGAGR